MTVFLIIGSIGLLILTVSLIVGEIFDGIFEALDIDFLGGAGSGPVMGSFLAAFGFGAALTMYSADTSTGISAVAGLGAGIVVGAGAIGITRSLMNMPTDESIKTTDLVGSVATVVTPISENGLGEITLVHRGQLMKLGARASTAISAGSPVTITAVTSPSSVIVAPTS